MDFLLKYHPRESAISAFIRVLPLEEGALGRAVPRGAPFPERARARARARPRPYRTTVTMRDDMPAGVSARSR